mmetsp:Transcript_47677/g.119160  ORF Transcript_47677/g.119160 Transcript_47677/m.119160 type:complete len:249 (+) Transcript_47677:112-858(+)
MWPLHLPVHSLVEKDHPQRHPDQHTVYCTMKAVLYEIPCGNLPMCRHDSTALPAHPHADTRVRDPPAPKSQGRWSPGAPGSRRGGDGRELGHPPRVADDLVKQRVVVHQAPQPLVAPLELAQPHGPVRGPVARAAPRRRGHEGAARPDVPGLGLEQRDELRRHVLRQVVARDGGDVVPALLVHLLAVPRHREPPQHVPQVHLAPVVRVERLPRTPHALEPEVVEAQPPRPRGVLRVAGEGAGVPLCRE